MLALPWPSPGNCQHPTWLLQVQPLDQGQGPQQPSATHNMPALERTLMHRFGPRKVFSVRAELGTIHLAPLAFNVMTMSGAFLSSTQGVSVCTRIHTHRRAVRGVSELFTGSVCAHTHTHTHTHTLSLSLSQKGLAGVSQRWPKGAVSASTAGICFRKRSLGQPDKPGASLGAQGPQV